MRLPATGNHLIQKGTWVEGRIEAIWFSATEEYWVFCRINKESFFVCPLDQTIPVKTFTLSTPGAGIPG